MKKQFTGLKELFVETYNCISENKISLHGSAIAFYSIFSAAPLMYILITLAGNFGNQQTINVLTRYLNKIIGHDMAQPLIAIANAAHHQTTSLFVSVLSIITLILGATTAIFQLRDSLNSIWEVEEPEVNSVLLYVIDRSVSVVVVFALMLLLFGTLLLDTWITSFSHTTHRYLPHYLSTSLSFIPDLIFVLVCVFFFTILFKLLPDVSVRWRDILAGACVTMALFFVGKFLIGIYLSSSSVATTYKTAGSFIIFLIWVYYNAQIILVGAAFTKAYTFVYGAGAQTVGGLSLFKKVE